MYPRLNYFRFFLAWSVLAFHTHILVIPFSGPIAVWCFFLISGYLVSNILYGCYQGRPQSFIVNRFLRIFPTYWAALAIGLAIAFIDPEGLKAVAGGATLPTSYTSLMNNLLIFGITPSSQPIIVPPAWSLAVELHWYLILFIGSFLPKRWVILFLLISLTTPFLITFIWCGAVYNAGAGFAFALGALAYHSNFKAPEKIQLLALLSVPVAMFIAPIYFKASSFEIASNAANACLIISAVLVYIALPWLTKTSNRKSQFEKLSNLAGELSYPLFLIHFYTIWIAMAYFDLPRVGWDTMLFSTLLSIALSLAIVKFIEHPIAVIRTSIRNQNIKTR